MSWIKLGIYRSWLSNDSNNYRFEVASLVYCPINIYMNQNHLSSVLDAKGRRLWLQAAPNTIQPPKGIPNDCTNGTKVFKES